MYPVGYFPNRRRGSSGGEGTGISAAEFATVKEKAETAHAIVNETRVVNGQSIPPLVTQVNTLPVDVRKLILGAGLFRRPRWHLGATTMGDEDWKSWVVFREDSSLSTLTFNVRAPSAALASNRTLWTSNTPWNPFPQDGHQGVWTLLVNWDVQNKHVELSFLNFEDVAGATRMNVVRGRDSLGNSINYSAPGFPTYVDRLPVRRFALLVYLTAGQFYYWVF